MTHPLNCPECGNRAAFNLATRTAHCGCRHTWEPTAEFVLFTKPGPDAGEADWDKAVTQMVKHLRMLRHQTKELS